MSKLNAVTGDDDNNNLNEYKNINKNKKLNIERIPQIE